MLALNVADYVAVTGDILVSKLVCAELIDTTIEVARFGVPEGESLASLAASTRRRRSSSIPMVTDRTSRSSSTLTGTGLLTYPTSR
jgi:hypothetical protein